MTSTLDRFRETRKAQGMPDFSDEDAAVHYINENTLPSIVAFPAAPEAKAYFVDTTKKEWFPKDSPFFLQEWAENIWQQLNRPTGNP